MKLMSFIIIFIANGKTQIILSKLIVFIIHVQLRFCPQGNHTYAAIRVVESLLQS